MSGDSPLTEAQAGALMSVLAKAENELAASMTAPLCWIIHRPDSNIEFGSALFLDAGEGSFAVTAHHVISEYQRHQATEKVVALRPGDDLSLDLNARNKIIATHESR